MERGDEGQVNIPTLPANAPTQAQAIPPQQQQQQPQPQPQPRQPEAALAGVLRGDNGPPPPPPKPERITSPRPTSSSTEKSAIDDGVSYTAQVTRERNDHDSRTPGGVSGPLRARSRRHGSGLDWIIPVNDEEKVYTPRLRTVGERLQPTLDTAHQEKSKYERKATLTGYLLNLAIGLQVLLGALVTGLSAAVSPSRVGLTTSILGGMSTLVASYLARMRGSNEPELSITRAKDLDQFIRECNAFQMDRGHITGSEEDQTLEGFRKRFEELLGNANGERKLSPV